MSKITAWLFTLSGRFSRVANFCKLSLSDVNKIFITRVRVRRIVGNCAPTQAKALLEIYLPIMHKETGGKFSTAASANKFLVANLIDIYIKTVFVV